MKLAILGTRGIPAGYGGFETFAEKLALGLHAGGIDVTVFCESHGSVQPETFEGIHLRYVVAPRLGPLQTILYDSKCLWAARKNYDVVYMLGYGAALFCLIPRMWNTEVWINPDGLEWARTKWGLLAKTYFRLMEWACTQTANRIIADAQAIAESLEERHGKLPHCTTIPYGCEVIDAPLNPVLLSYWELTPQSYFLVVCRLEPENHVLEILQAFQQSQSKRQLIVVGNHLSHTPYVARLQDVKDSRIRMIGTVYDQTKLTCLRTHAFGYLHGHSVGGTNPSLLEAMGSSNLIFAHDNPFNRETLGSCGFYFEGPRDLSLAINEAECSSGQLEELRNCAKSRARERYRWPDIIARYASLLEQVTARSTKN